MSIVKHGCYEAIDGNSPIRFITFNDTNPIWPTLCVYSNGHGGKSYAEQSKGKYYYRWHRDCNLIVLKPYWDGPDEEITLRFVCDTNDDLYLSFDGMLFKRSD